MLSVYAIVLSVLVGAVWGRGYVYFEPKYRAIGERALGSWSRWFNADNPFFYRRAEPGGDIETLPEIAKRYERHCEWGLPCTRPIGFEVDVSMSWRILYPASNISNAMRCTRLSPAAMTRVGSFQCLNREQMDMNWDQNGLPQECKRICPQTGQMYLGESDPRFAHDVLSNCHICPDFTLRFFCLKTSLDCQSRESYLYNYNRLRRMQMMGRS